MSSFGQDEPGSHEKPRSRALRVCTHLQMLQQMGTVGMAKFQRNLANIWKRGETSMKDYTGKYCKDYTVNKDPPNL